MSQHIVNLLPQPIVERSLAGLRTGRLILVTVMSLLVLMAAITTTRLELRRGRHELAATKTRADHVLEIERKAELLRTRRAALHRALSEYHQVSFPVNMSEVLGTVINALPPSATLDRIDMHAGARRVTMSPRSRGRDDAADRGVAPRQLMCEISGFAASDEHIAELVDRLAGRAPFQSVGLDFSRTRTVRNRPAREFRISFRIDLDRRYERQAPDAVATVTDDGGAP